MRSVNETSGQKSRSFIEEARRTQIVDAASAAVAELGYARTSLARIAEKAGISKGVITYHFSSKDEILRLVVTRFFEQGWSYMEERITAQATAAGQIRAWIGSELEFFGAHRNEFLAMIEIVTNHRDSDGTRAFQSELDDEVDGLAEILRHGQQSGELRDVDPLAVANIILRCTDGVLGSWASDPEIDLTAQSAVLLDFVDHAIRREPA